MLNELDGYSTSRIDSAEFYCDIKGMDVRLAVVKANDLYHTIMEAIVELKYVEMKYYKNNSYEVNFVRYIHLKNAIQDLNRIYDIALQIPWFLFRMWEKKNIFDEEQKERGKQKVDGITFDRKKADRINRRNDNWVSDVEELCKYVYVRKYFNNNNISEGKELLKSLDKFYREFLNNKHKQFTVRTLCNYIKHKGNFQPVELDVINSLTVNLGYRIEQKGVLTLKGKNCNIPNVNEAPEIEINNEDIFTINIKYSNNKDDFDSNFFGKDIIKKSYSIDTVYNECINYLNNFKPIYNLYFDILENYLYCIFPEPKAIKRISIDLNELYQKE